MKNYCFILCLLIYPLFSFSQGKSFWTKADILKFQQNQLLDRNSTPSKYDVYNLNIEDLKNTLKSAVSRTSNSPSNVTVQFPNATGEMENYEIYNASILEPEFAAKHPEIQSYVGVNIDNPGTTIRFSITVFGFHGIIHSIGATYYIDPFSKDLNTYVLYAKGNLYSDIERLGCQITEELETNKIYLRDSNQFSQRNANDGILRSFRFALASTQEYSNFHIDVAGQQTASDAVKRATVLAAMTVTMTRVNGLYERDLSVTLNLVDNTSIIFLEEDDGLDNSNTGNALLGQSQSTIDTNIGTANYDVGHMFSTGAGGVASLGGICFSNTKARALTGINNPVGDPFDIDFVSHEIGHHFGANHSYNGGQGNCGGQRNQATAVEPGSGTTIMAYAGICSGDNVQPNSDDHFHSISIEEMWARITSTTDITCSDNNLNGNTAPTVLAGKDVTIPFGTAFTLTGTGNDSDGDTISYCWEQVDTGTDTNQPNTTSTANPQFRSLSPTTDPDRTFPQLSDILNDNLTPQWEVIPNVARDLNFSLTVRDNQSPNGGQTNRDDVRVTLANTGPFIVTSPITTNESFPSGSTHTITWDVAGTDANGINTSNVNILLSTDGGQTFNTVLANNTDNDGSETISFPIINEAFCRIKIEPVGNIYFAISKSFSIGATINEVCNTYTSGLIATPIPDGSGTTDPVAGAAAFASLSVTETTTISDLKVTVDVSHTFVGDLLIQLQPPNTGDFVNLWSGNCGSNNDINVTFKDGEPGIVCGNPTTGTFSPIEALSDLNGLNPNGMWDIAFVDFFANDTGIINEFSIELCTKTITLDDENFELNDFALYPNPNKGEFNLQFNSNSGKTIDVNVYDISGKLVYTKTYDSTSRFDKTIALNNVSSGVYIMKVSDADRTMTKKLIIE